LSNFSGASINLLCDDEMPTQDLLDKFNKTICPHIAKVIERIDEKKHRFDELFKQMASNQNKKKNTGHMSVENALEDLSDEESNSSHGISKLISENAKIEVKP